MYCGSMTRSTVPRLPLSLPVMTITSSPFFILRMLVCLSCLDDFGRERNDLHETLGPQFAGYWSENTRADRLQLGGQQHRGIAVELDRRAVRAANPLRGAHDHGVINLALFDAPAGSRVLDADFDDVADAGI